MVTSTDTRSPTQAGTAYRTIWRWHFYAGLFVLPFILILSITGAIYLFKPQIERWEERAWLNLGTEGAVSPDAQLAAVLAANPGARFDNYRLPRETGDAAMVQLGTAQGDKRQVFVSPQGKVLGSFDPDTRIADTVARIHGTLLLGTWGDWLVELAASWTIVMILTGLYLWWPRPFRAAGTFWPRLSLKGRPLLKDIHHVTGFWIAGLVLIMLASGLPWAGAWGSAFKWARTELGLVSGPQDWKIGADGGHAGHHGAMPMAMRPASNEPSLSLATFVAKARGEDMAFPVIVLPPHAPQRFGPPTGEVWTVKSEAQNRWLGRQVTYEPMTGAETGRRGFADQHVIDRIVNTGVAWHEGQLFGWVNQLIGVVTALALVTISILGVVMWLKRRPQGALGAPTAITGRVKPALIVTFVLLALLLPLFGASATIILAVDWLVRRSTPSPTS
ncbi:putative iron-regulated membrane protein [Sphingobium wenxiniae]|uniref:Putative iron-regulated membrane protein n=1 Tax=Sphingobium wenxiniae (strain DSM 21828 / CGMCC 1.7748 / JZ-1) TaxID=595605 RepID=A0A562K4T1_SPHWJ|nr:PepSY domain-containing protein [Sphingobium wenxiniae]MBB6193750.1 putative iron-regulated membrane protein [Sphingobium wenxiniae]MDF0544673.1 PepSY domain-containing protein [Sphingobium arseniciresistens]TWH90234.1 putative iron-regulated membrane protein [Sphingobium wenxiniae]